MAHRSQSDHETETGSVVYDTYAPRFKKPVTCVIVAPRGSGKSVLLGDILVQNQTFFDDIHVFAGSQAVWNDFKGMLPPSRLSMGYTAKKMDRVMSQFKEIVNIYNAKNPGQSFQGALVMDDLGFDKAIFKCISHLEAWMKLKIGGNVSGFWVTPLALALAPR